MRQHVERSKMSRTNSSVKGAAENGAAGSHELEEFFMAGKQTVHALQKSPEECRRAVVVTLVSFLSHCNSVGDNATTTTTTTTTNVDHNNNNNSNNDTSTINNSIMPPPAGRRPRPRPSSSPAARWPPPCPAEGRV